VETVPFMADKGAATTTSSPLNVLTYALMPAGESANVPCTANDWNFVRHSRVYVYKPVNEFRAYHCHERAIYRIEYKWRYSCLSLSMLACQTHLEDSQRRLPLDEGIIVSITPL